MGRAKSLYSAIMKTRNRASKAQGKAALWQGVGQAGTDITKAISALIERRRREAFAASVAPKLGLDPEAVKGLGYNDLAGLLMSRQRQTADSELAKQKWAQEEPYRKAQMDRDSAEAYRARMQGTAALLGKSSSGSSSSHSKSEAEIINDYVGGLDETGKVEHAKAMKLLMQARLGRKLEDADVELVSNFLHPLELKALGGDIGTTARSNAGIEARKSLADTANDLKQKAMDNAQTRADWQRASKSDDLAFKLAKAVHDGELSERDALVKLTTPQIAASSKTFQFGEDGNKVSDFWNTSKSVLGSGTDEASGGLMGLFQAVRNGLQPKAAPSGQYGPPAPEASPAPTGGSSGPVYGPPTTAPDMKQLSPEHIQAFSTLPQEMKNDKYAQLAAAGYDVSVLK